MRDEGVKRNIHVKKNCFEGRIMSSTESSSLRRNRKKLICSPWVSGASAHLMSRDADSFGSGLSFQGFLVNSLGR